MTAVFEPVRPAPRQRMQDNDAWRQELVGLLHGALATELVCVWRYRRHHCTAQGLASPRIAEEFAVHAVEQLVHAARLAKRIVQLGGHSDINPDTLARPSQAGCEAELSLAAMILANLAAEREAIDSYSQMAHLVGSRDPSKRRLLEDLLADAQRHADELQAWLSA